MGVSRLESAADGSFGTFGSFLKNYSGKKDGALIGVKHRCPGNDYDIQAEKLPWMREFLARNSVSTTSQSANKHDKTFSRLVPDHARRSSPH